MSAPLADILTARAPLTLASVPTGFLPWLAADLARAAYGAGHNRRLVIIAADEAAMRALTDTIPSFAPEVEVLGFPAWDCLPYDRASPLATPGPTPFSASASANNGLRISGRFLAHPSAKPIACLHGRFTTRGDFAQRAFRAWSRQQWTTSIGR